MRKLKYTLIILFSILFTNCYNKNNKRKLVNISNKDTTISITDTISQMKAISEDTIWYSGTHSQVKDGVYVNSNIKVLPNKTIKTIKKQNISKSTYTSIDDIISTNNYDIISDGKLIYYIPRNMEYMKSYNVFIRISKKQVNIKSDIKNNIDTNKIVNINLNKLTETMNVELKDNSTSDNPAFSITKINNHNQLINDNEYTEWNYVVKPITSGSKSLSIVVSTTKDGKIKETVYSEIIEVSDRYDIKIYYFISKYWQYLLSTFIIPIFLYYRNKKKSTA